MTSTHLFCKRWGKASIIAVVSSHDIVKIINNLKLSKLKIQLYTRAVKQPGKQNLVLFSNKEKLEGLGGG